MYPDTKIFVKHKVYLEIQMIDTLYCLRTISDVVEGIFFRNYNLIKRTLILTQQIFICKLTNWSKHVWNNVESL